MLKVWLHRCCIYPHDTCDNGASSKWNGIASVRYREPERNRVLDTEIVSSKVP